ncbi:ABC transporter substrate binding protein [Desulfovibrio sp. TomC]|uniref:ABC transporter substrate binding protein n=1 Tax=Desulfovibrio sp. TomC TaxID=1562888 RepID=UPI000573E386|nr:ABC transporter substrate binding protein [Desulfovibrio sp. TomC]KHK00650.1 Serine/threonine protein kinase [Desulfovibrio sp. TomC]
MRNRCQGVFVGLVLTMAFFGGQACVAIAASPPPAVLLLASYHHGDPWSQSEIDGFESGLTQGEARVYVEHLDARRFPETADQSQFAAYLAAKYHKTPVAVLVACDDAALDFWLGQRAKLFPDRPLVFCGVNDFNLARLAGQDNITGVSESPDVVGTLELALALVPGARIVLAFGSDGSVTARANMERFRRATVALERRVRPVEILNASLESAAAALASAPTDAVAVRLTPLASGEYADFVRLGNDITELARVSSIPMFSLWDFDLGYGTVGGRVVRGFAQGRTAAGQVAEILAGRPARDIPVQDVPSEAVVDFQAMARFGLSMDRAPAGATVINEPATVYEQHKGLLWAGAAALAVFVPGAFVLGWLLTARRRTEARLLESERRYRELVECANSLILRFDAAGRLQFVNEYAERLLGYTREEMLAGKAVFWPAAPPDLSSLLARAMAAPQSLASGSSENEITSKDGRRVYLHWNNQPLFDAAGRSEGWLAVGSDITDRRLAEEALAARALAEEELSLFGRELLTDAPDAVDRALTRLLSAFSLGRATWFENVEDETLGLCSRLAGEACAAGLTLRRGQPALERLPYSLDGFQLADRLAAGEIIAGAVEDFPQSTQAVLQDFGVTAVLIAPVAQFGLWSGFVAVGEVRAPRRFTRQEQTLLSTAASLLSAHFSRRR